ncbi:Vesicle tethering protein Uso1/P115-like head domain [Trinorchestia longiramus]|nr:Vesicle tethering protein Uso1/P115-like head domain [Trinorchestia longiramus]
MEIIRSMTQTVLGNVPADQTPTGAETVERVVERVLSSSLLEDRRDGCRALRALARKYRLLVGAHAMDALLQALSNDRSDHELVNYALETLIAITSPEPFEEEIEESGNVEACRGLGQQFTEIVTKKSENIALFVELLDEFDFKVRFPTVKLLSNLLENRARGVQDGVLEVPSGVPKLMDLLSDNREVIRNHMLLLLTSLTRGNPTLQKIVVFENIYDIIFDIIREESYSEGSVVVEDCLELLVTLLRSSPPNQTLLREGGHVAQITTFFTVLLDDAEDPAKSSAWSAQKMANVHKMLELVSCLVQPESCSAEVRAYQTVLRASGVLPALCRMLLASGVPAATLTLVITTIADVIRAHEENQNFFSNVMAPSKPPRPAVVVLLMSMVNEKQAVGLRSAVLYCLHCLLCKNSVLQATLVATLLPQTVKAEDISSGQLLCGGLFSNDPTSTWLCAVALTHALHDNTQQKDELLRVQLATGGGGECVSLLRQCCTLLLSTSSFLAKVALLQLLALWLVQCPRAVTQLLVVPSVMPYLTAQISSSETEDPESQILQGLSAFVLGVCALYNEGAPNTLSRDQLASMVTDRIGSHVFRNKLSALGRMDPFIQAAKSPKISALKKSDLCFDYSFVSAYKSLEGSLLRAVNIGEADASELLERKVAELEAQLTAANEQVLTLTADKQSLTANVQQLTQQQQALQVQYQQQLQLLQQQNGSSGDSSGGAAIAALQQQVSELTYARDYYYYQMQERDKLVQQLQQQKQEEADAAATKSAVEDRNTDGAGSDPADPELETLRCQLRDLQLVLHKKDEALYQLQQGNMTNGSAEEDSKQLLDLKKKLESSEAAVLQLQATNVSLQKQLQAADARRTEGDSEEELEAERRKRKKLEIFGVIHAPTAGTPQFMLQQRAPRTSCSNSTPHFMLQQRAPRTSCFNSGHPALHAPTAGTSHLCLEVC